MLTQEGLKEVLTYEPATGDLRWRVPRGRGAVGKIAGIADGNRIVIKIEQKKYNAASLAWLWMTGELPGPNQIKHKNTRGQDNRWRNLTRGDSNDKASA